MISADGTTAPAMLLAPHDPHWSVLKLTPTLQLHPDLCIDTNGCRDLDALHVPTPSTMSEHS